MEKLFDKYSIIEKNGLFLFESIARNVVRTKNFKEYLKKAKVNYEINDGYVSEDTMIKIINRSKSSICNKFMKEYNKIKLLENANVNDDIDSLYNVDMTSGLFIFMGIPIDVLLDSDNNPWFIAAEIAKITGYSNTYKAVPHISTKNKIYKSNFNSAFDNNEAENNKNFTVQRCILDKLLNNTMLINESGLYELVLKSRKKEAKKFQEWLTSKVLPSIRSKKNYIDEKEQKGNFQIFFNLDDYVGKCCVYLLQIERNMYKYGDTYDIKSRLSNHKYSFDNYKCIKIFEFSSYHRMKEMAQRIKSHMKANGFHHKDKTTKKEELFKTTNKYTISNAIKDINNIYKDCKERDFEIDEKGTEAEKICDVNLPMQNNNVTSPYNIANAKMKYIETVNSLVQIGNEKLIELFLLGVNKFDGTVSLKTDEYNNKMKSNSSVELVNEGMVNLNDSIESIDNNENNKIKNTVIENVKPISKNNTKSKKSKKNKKVVKYDLAKQKKCLDCDEIICNSSTRCVSCCN